MSQIEQKKNGDEEAPITHDMLLHIEGGLEVMIGIQMVGVGWAIIGAM